MTIATQPTRTSSDLVLRVLGKVGVLSVGQDVAPEDAAKVKDNLDSIFRMLGALEIAYVPDPDNVPSEWFESLAAIVAGELASDFAADAVMLKGLGLGGPPSQSPYGAGAGAMALKIMTRGRPTGEPQRSEYF